MGPLCRTLGSVCVKDPGGPAGAGETEVAPFTGCLSAYWEATSHGGREDEAVPSPKLSPALERLPVLGEPKVRDCALEPRVKDQ